MEDEYVLEFVDENSMTPIDIVSEVTGLTYEEIRSCYSTVDYNNR